MRISEIQPGDMLQGPNGWGILIGSTPHPIYPGLMMYIWRMSSREYVFDAIRPDQIIDSASTVHTFDQQERKKNLKWATRQHGATKPKL